MNIKGHWALSCRRMADYSRLSSPSSRLMLTLSLGWLEGQAIPSSPKSYTYRISTWEIVQNNLTFWVLLGQSNTILCIQPHKSIFITDNGQVQLFKLKQISRILGRKLQETGVGIGGGQPALPSHCSGNLIKQQATVPQTGKGLVGFAVLSAGIACMTGTSLAAILGNNIKKALLDSPSYYSPKAIIL